MKMSFSSSSSSGGSFSRMTAHCRFFAAFVGLTLPLTVSHMQLSYYWLKVAAATLVALALATLLASALGALLAVALQSVIPTLTHVWGIPLSGATVSFGCPRDVAKALLNNGKLLCSANETAFVLDDMARTFVTASMTQTVSYISEQVVQVAESLLSSECALIDSFLDEKQQEREDADDCHPFHDKELEQKQDLVILQLVTQAEAVDCRVLSWLQAYLPVSVAFMISSVSLQTSAFPFTVDSGDTAVVSAVYGAPSGAAPVSSIMALPATVSAVVASKRVSPALAFIVCSTATVLNQTGAALYLSASTLFALSAAALDKSKDQVIASRSTTTVADVFTNVLVANVISSLPGGSKTAVLATTLNAVFGVSTGLRAVLVAFLAALEWVTGPFVACVNITNNALIALVIAHYFEAQSVAETEADSDESSSVTHEASVLALRQLRVQDMADENWGIELLYVSVE
ncbi:unnamed protein product [Peronospora destructor]|uniref:Amino acid transporter n=1 Tax=Peronospora destructor TaxID=86335 RepID=A0AAV0T578_9STRA|nr:unnamed protein product [Peronospora destructor]